MVVGHVRRPVPRLLGFERVAVPLREHRCTSHHLVTSTGSRSS